MSRVLRLLITCLLALALPWQGVAAATMLWCSGSPMTTLEQPAAAHTHLSGHAGPQDADAGDGHAMEHAPGQVHDDTHVAAQAHAASDDQAVAHADRTHEHGGNSSAGHSCTTCATCCAAAAGPALPLVIACQVPTVSALARPPQAGVPAFVTDGPERPPRQLA